MDDNKYICAFCGAQIQKNNRDKIWRCETCGKYFCSRCLQRAAGSPHYTEMTRFSGYVMCPDCVQKEAESI